MFPSKIGDDDQKLDNIYFLFTIIRAMLSVENLEKKHPSIKQTIAESPLISPDRNCVNTGVHFLMVYVCLHRFMHKSAEIQLDTPFRAKFKGERK